MTDAKQDKPAEPLPQSRGGRARRFVFDVIALNALLLAVGVSCAWMVALWFDGNVTEVSGFTLRLVAAIFFFRVFQLYVMATLLGVGLLVLLMKYRKIALANLLMALILGLPFLRAYLPKRIPVTRGATIKVYSANLYAQNRDGESIVRSIRAENPDVVVLVEVTNWSHSLLMKEFGDAYPFQHRPRYNGGAMILSRVAFREDPPVVQLRGNHSRVPVIFNLDGKELAMYPVHLLSPGKLSLIAQHREQVRELLEIEREEKRPMIIVGDCNMTPQTPNYGALRRVGFQSSGEMAGFGLGNTWGPRWWPKLYQMPGVQIDHILLQPPLVAKWHKIGLDTGSDHRPIVAEIGFADHGSE